MDVNFAWILLILEALANWTEAYHHCNWSGVVCDPPSNRVISISTAEKQLQGQISPFLGNLCALQGPIPSELGNLQNLQYVHLGANLSNGNNSEREGPDLKRSIIEF
ncbi:conserved hypothetical protein [Ricinus communis]|uniref:Leucine-rich repeat-containing N-terminal plant-type domain-containing protein n=1 Tax=Ricinus communis TaxID=3988 RepID=B9SF46_RICCO|nr:conserved hypothetical protein [Ricinus communis]